MEVNWFGSGNPTEHSFHVTDRFLREQGYTLFGLTTRKYSRNDLPAPFEVEAYARDDLRPALSRGTRSTCATSPLPGWRNWRRATRRRSSIKLACLYELIGLVDCAAEVLNRFEDRLAPFGVARAAARRPYAPAARRAARVPRVHLEIRGGAASCSCRAPEKSWTPLDAR